MAWDPDEAATAAQFGVPIEWGDQPRMWKVVADEINANGGIAGRELKLEVWEYDGSSASMDEIQNAVCTHFTQDVEVFTVYLRLGDDVSFQCYDDARMPYVQDIASLSDEESHRRFPNLFSTAMNYTRVARLMVDGLARQGFFSGSPRIGLVTIAAPFFDRAVEQSLIPALERHGLELAENVAVTEPRSTALLGKSIQETNAAMIKFRAEGIDRVLFLDGGFLAWAFMNAAEGQQYHGFRYGLTSLSVPGATTGAGSYLPEGQLEHSVGLGWVPFYDLRELEARSQLSSAGKHCVDLMREAGIRFSQTCCDMRTAVTICEQARFIDAAVEVVGRSTVNAETFRIGAESLGKSFTSAMTLGTRFGPEQHDGVSAYRDLIWVESCRCMRYSGPLRRVPG